ncbi:MAG: hypothetical protein OQK67_01710 [Chlorobium sp.]|nr:hypothetical protein [Chlorobium sp.]MCW8815122.1 hypothetical protein [Chlorobium sp.]MCW8819455.1 hypothetical protein [Ignavibacteriaceae bacterium]
MLNGSFKSLWNRAVFSMGGLWAVLVYMIWESGQLTTVVDRQVFMTVIVCGFLVIYFSGFVIAKRNSKKKQGA